MKKNFKKISLIFAISALVFINKSTFAMNENNKKILTYNEKDNYKNKVATRINQYKFKGFVEKDKPTSNLKAKLNYYINDMIIFYLLDNVPDISAEAKESLIFNNDYYINIKKSDALKVNKFLTLEKIEELQKENVNFKKLVKKITVAIDNKIKELEDYIKKLTEKLKENNSNFFIDFEKNEKVKEIYQEGKNIYKDKDKDINFNNNDELQKSGKQSVKDEITRKKILISSLKKTKKFYKGIKKSVFIDKLKNIKQKEKRNKNKNFKFLSYDGDYDESSRLRIKFQNPCTSNYISQAIYYEFFDESICEIMKKDNKNNKNKYIKKYIKERSDLKKDSNYKEYLENKFGRYGNVLDMGHGYCCCGGGQTPNEIIEVQPQIVLEKIIEIINSKEFKKRFEAKLKNPDKFNKIKKEIIDYAKYTKEEEEKHMSKEKEKDPLEQGKKDLKDAIKRCEDFLKDKDLDKSQIDYYKKCIKEYKETLEDENKIKSEATNDQNQRLLHMEEQIEKLNKCIRKMERTDYNDFLKTKDIKLAKISLYTRDKHFSDFDMTNLNKLP